jgi:hypothetical protein
MTLQIKFEAVSNRADWFDHFVVTQNGSPFDLATAEIDFTVRGKDSLRTRLRATVGNGITLATEAGEFDLLFTAAQTRALEASFVYEVGCTITRGGNTWQYLRGTVPVLDGIVE